MACYIVTFELKSPAHVLGLPQTALKSRLAGLQTALKSYPGYCPLNATSWAIKTDKKAREVRDHLATKLGPGDRLFVIRSGSEGAWRNPYGEENNDWLKKNL